MAANVLIEELGPKGKRKVLVATSISLVLLAILVVIALIRLNDNGQLEAARWADLFEGDMLRFLAQGLWSTVSAAAVAGFLATIIGFGLALTRMSESAPARVLAISWVEFFRGVPLLLTVLGVFAVAGADNSLGLGIFWSVVVALVLYNSAVLSEIFRAGVRSLDKGQSEAAKAVGMTYWQMMFLVVLPQAVRRMVPAIVAQMATLTKDVSLGFVIGYAEFVRRGSNASNQAGTEVGNFQSYVFVAVVYFILVWLLAKLAEIMESRQKTTSKVAEGGGSDVPADVAAIGDPAVAPL